MKLGDIIQEQRKLRGWSQTRVAEHLQVSRAAVSQWEAHQTKPSLQMLQQLSGLFGLSVDLLLDPANPDGPSIQNGIDPLLVDTWKRLTPKQRRRLAQIALIIAEE